MSELKIFSENNPSKAKRIETKHSNIAKALSEKGIRFERWTTNQNVIAGDSQEKIISAYKKDIDRLIASDGYQTVDVISLDKNHPQKKEMREKFLSEHTHSENEVRFFVDGEGLFSLHLDHDIFEILCQKGDLISVPANTKHWFDMGPNPNFIAIRLFNNPEGWVANFTGSDIAGNFSRLIN